MGKSPKAAFITGYLAALLATIIWGGNFIAARALADKIPPCQLNLWRWLSAFLVLLPFAIPHLSADLKVLRERKAYFCWMAFIGVTLMNIFIYTAGQTTSSLNMALIMPATPIVIIILGRLIYHIPISFWRLIGMMTAFFGIVFLICQGNIQRLLQLNFTAGDLWTLAGMFCFAIFSLFQKQRPEAISSLGFNTIIFGLGIMFCIPFVLYEFYTLPLPACSNEIIIGILYSGVGCSSLAFWLWTIAIDRIGPVRTSIIYYSLPIYTAIMATLILNEHVLKAQIIGGFLILGGIILASFKQSKAS